MTKIALNAKFEPEERLMKMKNMLDSISISDANPDECHISKYLDDIVADIISGKLPETVSTGIYDLDELLAGGFSKGDFVLIAGDTRNYKSTLMYNTDLEFKVTSILFNHPHLLGHRLVNRDDFFTDNGDSIEKMLIIHDRGGIINETTIGKKYPDVTNEDVEEFKDYVRTLKGLSFERRLQNLPDEMTKIALNAKFEPEERLMKMKNMLDSISISDANPDECHISKFLDEIVADIVSGKLPDTISTGIYDLDELLAGGFSKGDFVLIAGDTRNYKSTLMYNICLNVAMQGKPVIIFSYENTKKEIIEILISMLALLNSRILKSRKIHNTSIKDDEQIIAKIEKAKQQLLKLPLFIVDADVDLTDIKLLSLTHKVELVAIDYIQIMPETKKMGKTEAVGRISRDLKMFTKPDA